MWAARRSFVAPAPLARDGTNCEAAGNSWRPSALREIRPGDPRMPKLVKQLQRQADKAERLAIEMKDPELSKDFADLAAAYRAQAETVKLTAKKKGKKTRAAK
jgi:hypothetical protein